MNKYLDLHDSQILKIITNPVRGSMQIILSYRVGRIMEMQIEEIKQIRQDNIECLSLFYESAGGIDDAYIEESENEKTLVISGIIDFNYEAHENINWSFSITAGKIDILEHSISDNMEDFLYDNNFIPFNKILSDS